MRTNYSTVRSFSGLFPRDLRRASVVWNEQTVADCEQYRILGEQIRAEQDRIIRADRIAYFYYRVSETVNSAMTMLREKRAAHKPLTKAEYAELYRLQDAFNYYWDKFLARQEKLDFSSVAELQRERAKYRPL